MRRPRFSLRWLMVAVAAAGAASPVTGWAAAPRHAHVRIADSGGCNAGRPPPTDWASHVHSGS
jgi:hypothetical protein